MKDKTWLELSKKDKKQVKLIFHELVQAAQEQVADNIDARRCKVETHYWYSQKYIAKLTRCFARGRARRSMARYYGPYLNGVNQVLGDVRLRGQR